MKILKKILLVVLFSSMFWGLWVSTYAADTRIDSKLLDVRDQSNDSVANRNQDTESFVTGVEGSMSSYFGNTFTYFTAGDTGAKWARSLLINVARDLKNVFFLVALIYLVISVLRILLSGGSEEDAKKWRRTIIWTSVGIVVMQSAFAVIETLYNKNVNGQTANDFALNIIYPFVHLLEVSASFAFLAMAIYAFYRIITAGGGDEALKNGRRTIMYAIIGFLVIKLPATLVRYIYGDASSCTASSCNPDVTMTVGVFSSIVNYVNSFLALVIVIMVVYAGFLVLTCAGDEEKVKKAKKIMQYVVVWALLLTSSYIIFNFFLLKRQ